MTKEEWEVSVEKIITLIEKNTTDYKKKEFKEWLLSKKSLGFRFFDAMMYLRAFFIVNKLKKDYDHVSVFAALEGKGKSTNAIQFCAVVSPTFSLKHICYNMNDFIEIIREADKGDSILLDEGGMFLFSREAMSETNRILVKLLMLARQKNLHICICIPLFHVIDSYIRDHRVATLIHIPNRGQLTLYINKAIKIISEKGQKYKTISNIRVPNGTFSQGYFVKKFPIINDINQDTYKQHKEAHLNKFIDEIQSKLDVTPAESEYMTIAEARTIVPLAQTTFMKLLREKKLEGKLITNKWFIKRESLKTLNSPRDAD